MKLLLDTHIFLWFISGDRKLPAHLQNSIRDLNNEVCLNSKNAPTAPAQRNAL
ncbi:MAG: hypothetical protein RMY28_032500 [Nostoc sp. ChiSLP01]|nr:hypothetical protein [Nostoc sp. CmiSLP01]MDZ8284243.1 hypothetical protein [Nostoc sp. ChiSLP01]